MTASLRRLISTFAFLAAALGSSVAAHAGIWWGSYWGLDYYTTWTYQPTAVTVPTGYYWGSYTYPYYNPYSGWYYSVPIGYGSYTWGGPSWFYGFRDSMTYIYWRPTPRRVFGWSWYFDPANENQAQVLDMFTDGNDSNGNAIAFDNSIATDVTVMSHTVSINDDSTVQSFSDLTWVTASSSAITSYLNGLGLTPGEISEFLGQDKVQQVIASNNNGTGDKVVGLQYILVPEGATFGLLALGSVSLIRRRRRL